MDILKLIIKRPEWQVFIPVKHGFISLIFNHELMQHIAFYVFVVNFEKNFAYLKFKI